MWPLLQVCYFYLEPEAEEQGVPCVCTIASFVCKEWGMSLNVVVADVISISVLEPEAEEQGVPCVCTIATYVCRSEGSL